MFRPADFRRELPPFSADCGATTGLCHECCPPTPALPAVRGRSSPAEADLDDARFLRAVKELTPDIEYTSQPCSRRRVAFSRSRSPCAMRSLMPVIRSVFGVATRTRAFELEIGDSYPADAGSECSNGLADLSSSKMYALPPRDGVGGSRIRLLTSSSRPCRAVMWPKVGDPGWRPSVDSKAIGTEHVLRIITLATQQEP